MSMVKRKIKIIAISIIFSFLLFFLLFENHDEYIDDILEEGGTDYWLSFFSEIDLNVIETYKYKFQFLNNPYKIDSSYQIIIANWGDRLYHGKFKMNGFFLIPKNSLNKNFIPFLIIYKDDKAKFFHKKESYSFFYNPNNEEDNIIQIEFFPDKDDIIRKVNFYFNKKRN